HSLEVQTDHLGQLATTAIGYDRATAGPGLVVDETAHLEESESLAQRGCSHPVALRHRGRGRKTIAFVKVAVDDVAHDLAGDVFGELRWSPVGRTATTGGGASIVAFVHAHHRHPP